MGDSAELPNGLLMLDGIVMNRLDEADKALWSTLGFRLLQSCCRENQTAGLIFQILTVLKGQDQKSLLLGLVRQYLLI